RLGGFQDGQSSARSGAEEERGPAREPRRAEELGRPDDRGPRLAERVEDAPVLGLHERDDALDPDPVEPGGFRVRRLGRELAPEISPAGRHRLKYYASGTLSKSKIGTNALMRRSFQSL